MASFVQMLITVFVILNNDNVLTKACKTASFNFEIIRLLVIFQNQKQSFQIQLLYVVKRLYNMPILLRLNSRKITLRPAF